MSKARYAREKERAKTDIIYRLKNKLRSKVFNKIKELNIQKQSSQLDLLGSTIEEIKSGLENKFEYWMNWDNYGNCDLKSWNDNNPHTWTWVIHYDKNIEEFPADLPPEEKIKQYFSIENIIPINARKRSSISGKIGGDIRKEQFIQHRIENPIIPKIKENTWADYIISSLQHNLIEAHMLGDGHMAKYGAQVNPYFSIDRTVKDINYLEYSRNIFQDITSAPISYYNLSRDHIQKGKIYYMCKFSTRSCPYLLHDYYRWYPNGKKIVPKDLKLNALIIALWLCDDGCVSLRGKNKNILRIVFCTDGFSVEENEFLAGLLTTRYNAKFLLNKNGLDKNGNMKTQIVAYDYASRRMCRDIDAVFPISMIRKAKWREPQVKLFDKNNDNNLPHNKNRFIL